MNCAILIFDRKATNERGVVTMRPCGAATGQTLSVRGDLLIAICSRHNKRLERALGPIAGMS